MKLQEDENILHEMRPEKIILAIWFFTKCLPIAVPAGFAGGLGTGFLATLPSDADFAFGSAFIGAGILGLPALVLALIYCRYLQRTFRYYVTSQRCVFTGGIIRRIQRSIPYHKITDIEMSQNIVERVLGISTLNIFTPGTASVSDAGFQKAEISFVGLKDNEKPAVSINQILRKFRATGE